MRLHRHQEQQRREELAHDRVSFFGVQCSVQLTTVA
jgi:hypothetical protein